MIKITIKCRICGKDYHINFKPSTSLVKEKHYLRKLTFRYKYKSLSSKSQFKTILCNKCIDKLKAKPKVF